MSDESLRAYISGIAKHREGGGFELAYSPEWEARIYLTGLRDFDLWRELPNLQIPTLIIRGAESDTFLPKTGELVKRKNPKIQVKTLAESTHLLPLERPQEVFEMMREFAKNVPMG
jgi:pimeloyl-ACP methyl ester carboxylesterase